MYNKKKHKQAFQYELKDSDASLQYNYYDIVTKSTALMFACCNNRIDDALKILELNHNNEDINYQNRYGMTALMYAVRLQNGTILINQLIQHGADINIKDIKGRTAIIYAMQSSNKDALIQLLENNAIVNYAIYRGGSPLLYAIIKGPDYVNILLKFGVQIEYSDYLYIITRIKQEIASNNAEDYLNKNERIKAQVNKVFQVIQKGDKQEIVNYINSTDIYFGCYHLLSTLFEIEERLIPKSNIYSEIIYKIKEELDSFYEKNNCENDGICLQIENLLQSLEEGNDSDVVKGFNQTDVYLTGFDSLYEISSLKNRLKNKEEFKYNSLDDIPHSVRKTQSEIKQNIFKKKIKDQLSFKYRSIQYFVYSNMVGDEFILKLNQTDS